jgi:hypothetical protein
LQVLSDAIGHFIAGFIEGEGHFGIAEMNGGQSFCCFMSLRVRDDDTALLEWLQATTGLGVLYAVPARATSNPQVQWLVRTRSDCDALVQILDRFELRGRKAREFEIWKRAVALWNSEVPDRALVAEHLRRGLIASRRFAAPRDGVVEPPTSADALSGYLHGFLCAEGSLSLDRSHTGLTVHLRQDDRPLLEMFMHRLGVGYVSDHPAYGSSRPSSAWRVARLDDVARLASRLDPGRMRGRKAAELEVWLRAIAERRRARAAGRRPQLDALIAAFRAAREYQPGDPLRKSPPRDVVARENTLQTLRRWAEHEPGALSGGRYAGAREPGWPHRNTIARQFGSWDAALRAAGLADRLARPKPRPVGGDAQRDAHLAAQRERVLATLRYGIVLHGSIPTATQFFRWRLVDLPATPSQATIYRLFPGGWQAVLDALAEQDPDVMRPPVIRP